MLPKVSTVSKEIKDYKSIIDPDLYKEILSLAKGLKKLKVVHVNSTSQGGGVAELLHSLNGLMCSVGLDSNWHVIQGAPEFFDVTKKMHNTLQGQSGSLSQKEKDIYLKYNKKFASLMKGMNPDIWVIHDPQPAAALSFLPEDKKPAVNRIHIDTSTRNEQVLDFVLPFWDRYSRLIFTMREFVCRKVPKDKIKIFSPAIDPLAPKNQPTDMAVAKSVIEKFGVNPDKPLITQVSRFDYWKDPIGVIKAYYLAKNKISDLQLSLVGLAMALDDPEAAKVFEEVKKHAKGDPDIFMFSDLKAIEKEGIDNDTFVNAFQTASDFVIQKSLKEGFGLVITEALWKGKAVIGGNVGGVKLQIDNGKNGFLVDSVEECAEKIIYLMENKDILEKMGKMAKIKAKKEFLTPRLLRDYLKLFKELV